jgi:hypothetical protein
MSQNIKATKQYGIKQNSPKTFEMSAFENILFEL